MGGPQSQFPVNFRTNPSSQLGIFFRTWAMNGNGDQLLPICPQGDEWKMNGGSQNPSKGPEWKFLDICPSGDLK